MAKLWTRLDLYFLIPGPGSKNGRHPGKTGSGPGPDPVSPCSHSSNTKRRAETDLHEAAAHAVFRRAVVSACRPSATSTELPANATRASLEPNEQPPLG